MGPVTGLSISAGLHLIQRRVATAHSDKLVVATGFDDASIIQHENLVGHSDGREPVADQAVQSCRPIISRNL